MQEEAGRNPRRAAGRPGGTSARRCAGRALPLPRSARRPRREGARPADVRRGDWQRPALYRAAGGLAPLSQERSRFSSEAGERPRAGVSRGAARGAERGEGGSRPPGGSSGGRRDERGRRRRGERGEERAGGAGEERRGGERSGAEGPRGTALGAARTPRWVTAARPGAARRPAPGAGSAEVALAAPPGLGPPPPRRARPEAPRGPAGRRGRGRGGRGPAAGRPNGARAAGWPGTK